LWKLIKFFLVFIALSIAAVIILFADRGQMPAFIAQLYNFPNGDKVGHFFLMGGLAFITGLLLPDSWKKRGLFVLAGLIALEEFSQLLFSHRTFSLLDLACSLAGVAAFGLLSLWLSRLNKNRAKRIVFEQRSR
jgi:polysaccharide biosynthesis protein VpsQ